MRWEDLRQGAPDELKRLAALSDEDLLGISPGATEREVRTAYRAKCLAYHPDKAHPFMRSHNEAVLKLLNAAYSRLIAAIRRTTT